MRHRRRFNLTLGFYMPSLFHLHVHTKKFFKNLWKWDDETFCTFLHEYIHFLQDVSTVSGLHNICLTKIDNRFIPCGLSFPTVPDISKYTHRRNMQNWCM